MNYNVRIDDNFLRADHVDGEVLQHTDLNELENVVKTAINANYEDIQKLQDGSILIGNSEKLDGATLSTFAEEPLQNSDNKIPTAMQTKQYVDSEISNIDLGGYYTKREVDDTLDSNNLNLDANHKLEVLSRTFAQYQGDGDNSFIAKGTLQNVIDELKQNILFKEYRDVTQANALNFNTISEGLYYTKNCYITIGPNTMSPEDLEEPENLWYVSTFNHDVRAITNISGSYFYIIVKSGSSYSATKTLTVDEQMLDSVLEGYVKPTDYASKTKGGAVKIDTDYGLGMLSNGTVYGESKSYDYYTVSAPDNLIVSKGTLNNILRVNNSAYQAALDNLENKKADKSSLSTVATSGDYNDLSNKPSIPTKVSDLTNDSGYVKNTDYPTNSKSGVIFAGNEFTVSSHGVPSAGMKTYANYLSSPHSIFISKYTLENVITGKELVNQTTLNESQEEQDTIIDGLTAELEQTQADLHKTQAELEVYKMVENALPKVTGSGTQVTLDNTANAGMKMTLNPSDLSQETTTGKNKLNVSSNYSVTGRVEMSLTLPAGTYHITSGQVTNGGSNSPVLVGFGNWFYLNSNGDVTRTLSQDTTLALEFYSNGYNYNDSQGITSTIRNLMISTEGGDYEPYTGGIASPNTQYPQEVHTISGDNTIKVEGGNLFEPFANGSITGTTEAFTSIATVKQTFNYSKILTFNNGEITGYPAIGNGSYYIWKLTFNLKPNTTYSLSCDFEFENLTGANSSGNIWIFNNVFVSSNKTSLKDKVKAWTFTTGNDGKYTPPQFINIDPRAYQETTTMKIYNILLVEGSYTSETMPSYLPYVSQKADIDLGDLEYSKIGNYADEFYKATDSDTSLISGKWYLKKNIGKVVLGGSENWVALSALNTNDYYAYYYANSNFATPSDSIVGVISNYFIGDKRANRTENIPNCWLNNSASQLFIHSPETTASNFQTWLASNNTEVDFIRANPTYTPLNDTLQSQLDTIESMLLSYKGQTNISQINNDLPFVITSTALKDLEDLNV